jgi:cytochrome c biogenesis protein CcdA
MTRLASVALLALACGPAFGQRRSFETAVESIKATVDPPVAHPGQTVTYRVEVKLNPTWLTYPTRQPDQSENASQTRIVLPPPRDLIFVEPITDPDHMKTKPGPSGILSYYTDAVTWETKAVVSPKATEGEKKVELAEFRIIVCYKQGEDEGCLPPKTVKVKADLNVSGSPVAVEDRYKSAVDRALGNEPPNPPPPSPGPPRVGPKDVEPAGPPPAKGPPKSVGPKRGSEGPDVKPIEAEGPRAGGRRLSADHDHAADLAAVAEQLPKPDSQRSGFWAFVGTAALWGLITLLTPCVFPMVPITVSIFVKQSEKQGTNVLAQALTYALTIVVLLSVAAMTLLTTFKSLAVHPVTNVLLGALFVVLALSLFGLFEITLPSSLATRLDNRAAQGGYAGTVFMAASFTVVSFTCVAPFLGGFTGLTASGNFSTLELAAGAVAFAVAFASPFFLLAVFPSLIKKLPKSGDWMNMVKVTMGFLELAAALKFFRTAELRWLTPPEYFTYDLVLALWVGILLAMALYLLGVFRTKHDHEMHDHVGPWRIMFALGALGLAAYLLPALFPRGPHERHRPGGTVYAWVDSFLLPEPSAAEVVGGALPWSADLRRTLDDARAKNGRVFVDFTGVTCTNCKLNEKNVFIKPEVQELFGRYSLVQMYTDTIPEVFYDADPGLTRRNHNADANQEFELKALGTEQLPLYVILKPEPNGKTTVVGVYREGKINDEPAFVEFLKNGLK